MELDQRGLRRKYPTIKELIRTSCAADEGIHQLQEAIRNAVAALPHVYTPLPTSWIAIKEWLEEMDKDYISYSEYVQLCQAKEVQKEEEQRNLIRFLHDFGTILNFQDDRRLEDTNVLDPEWVTQGIYQILDSDLLPRNEGLLHLNQLSEILNHARYPSYKHPFIMDMMRKFELCFAFPGQLNQYLIPELLPKEEPKLDWDMKDCLAFQYHYDILPSSIFSRFIVRIHNYISTSRNEYGCWYNGVEYFMKGTRH